MPGALAARDALANRYPESSRVAALDRRLESEPGERPRDEVFIRPYKVRGAPQPGQP